MPDRLNLRRNLDYRSAVGLWLSNAGLPASVPTWKKPSEALADPLPGSHIAGLEDIVLLTRAASNAQPAEALTAARDAADDTGQAVAAVAIARPGREVQDSFVVLTLRDFSELLRQRAGLPS